MLFSYASEGVPYLRGDLAVRGVWETHGEAMFDIRVVDTDTISYISRSVSAVLKNFEEEKQSIRARVKKGMQSFTSLVL